MQIEIQKLRDLCRTLGSSEAHILAISQGSEPVVEPDEKKCVHRSLVEC